MGYAVAIVLTIKTGHIIVVIHVRNHVLHILYNYRTIGRAFLENKTTHVNNTCTIHT